MSGLIVAIFVPAMMFMIFVAPLWVIMHYRSLRRSSSSLTSEEREGLEKLLHAQHRLLDRVQSIEAILDADHPRWRQQSGLYDVVKEAHHG